MTPDPLSAQGKGWGLCGTETRLSGYIVDADSRLPLPNALVRIEGHDTFVVRSASDGSYSFCDPPSDTPLVISAEFADRITKVVVSVPRGFHALRDLPLSLQAQGHAAVLGRVVDMESGLPVVGASVRFGMTPPISRVSDERGVFILPNVDAGRYLIQVDALGYESRTDTLVLASGRAVDLRVSLARRPIELEPLQVTVRSRRWFGDLAGFHERRRRGFGAFISEPELAERGFPPLQEALRGIPGIRVRKRGYGYFVEVRQRKKCSPVYYLDGVKYRLDSFGLAAITGSDVSAIEVYRGAAEVPGEFGGSDAACGVIVIWTKR